jgi:hypothetical protein
LTQPDDDLGGISDSEIALTDVLHREAHGPITEDERHRAAFPPHG